MFELAMWSMVAATILLLVAAIVIWVVDEWRNRRNLGRLNETLDRVEGKTHAPTGSKPDSGTSRTR